MYFERNPHPLLAPYVRAYWLSDGEAAGSISQTVLPDGCSDIVFALPGNREERSLPYLTPYVVGVMTSFSDFTYNGRVRMLGVRFRPGGLGAFIRTPAHELADLSLPLAWTDNIVFKSIRAELREDLADSRAYFSCLDKALLDALPKALPLDAAMAGAARFIEQRQGWASLRELAASAHICPRQFERRFKAAVGLGPKAFGNIARFNAARALLCRYAGRPLWELALEAGYHDHAHLHKEFKRLSGRLPSFYLR